MSAFLNEVLNIWKSYMWTAEWRIKWRMVMAVIDSTLIGRALHRYRSGQGFESRTSLNFFQAFFPNCKSCVYNCDDHPSFKCFRFCCCCCLVFFFFLWNRNVLGFHVMKEREPNCKTPHRNFNSLSDETHGKSELTVHKQSRGYKRNKKKEGSKIYKNDSFNIWQSK